MNISAVSPAPKRREDFDALQSALQSGNISSAQTAFAAFLQDVQKTAQGADRAVSLAPAPKRARIAELGERFEIRQPARRAKSLCPFAA